MTTQDKQPEQPQVEQWMRDAAKELCAPGSPQAFINAYAEIIARHAPKRAAAVEELVRAAKVAADELEAIAEVAGIEAAEQFRIVAELRSALAALEGK